MLSERQLASAAAAAAAGANRERQEEAAEDEENIVIDMTEEDEDEDEYLNGDEEPSYPYGTVRAFNNNNNNNISHLADANSCFPSNSEEEFIKSESHSKMANFEAGDLVWFDPNLLGYCIPGKVVERFPELCILTVEGRSQPAARLSEPEAHNQALLRADEESQLEVYDLSDPLQIASLIPRAPFVDERGVGDLVDVEQLSLESIVWNLKLRHKKELVYTRCGLRILVSVNPYKQLSNLYNLDQVNLYDSTTSSANQHKLPLAACKSHSSASRSSEQLLRWLMLSSDRSKIGNTYVSMEPHIFAMANEALRTLLVTGQDQCFLLLGESGSGKTESCKLVAQYLATVNKSPTNLVTEQILESIQVLESFGNAKTKLNDNASRFGKLLEIRFQMSTGFITSAKTNYLNLLDGSRIIGQSEGERNYHIFYELLAGLSSAEREKYGLQNAEKYFYLNQGQCFELPSKEDGQDFRSLLASMQVLGFDYQEQDAIFRILASVLHLGNIYFHRKVLTLRSANSVNRYAEQQPSGIEGVEIGSDNEVRWISHLLQIQYEAVVQCLTIRTSDSASLSQPKERIMVPLNIDQALDSRDAMARALYSYLFKWLIQRINAMTGAKHEQMMMSPAANHNLNQESIYLCQTSESLCEFQPDKLRATSTLCRSSSSIRHPRVATLSILDVFGFENLSENNFEQLCINSAAELLAYHTSRYLLRLEQAEYTRERLLWEPINLYSYNVNTSLSQLSNSEFYASSNGAPVGGFHQSAASSVMQLLIKKPLGILALLDDECNFPKATDQSFIEKCNHNHTLNESYQRARTSTNQAEFGIKHFGLQARLTWYQVEGFIEKNRDSLRPEIVELLLSSKMNVVCDIVRKLGGKSNIDGSGSNQRTLSRTHDGRYVSMKPRATSVAARFQETLQSSVALEAISCGSTSNDMQLASGLTRAQPWFVFCFQPNRWRVGNPKVANVFDVAYVEEQARALNLMELTQIRRSGYHVKLRYNDFVNQYKCLLTRREFERLTISEVSRSASSEKHNIVVNKQSHKEEQRRAIREVCCGIVATKFPAANKAQYQCGLTKMFLNERFFQELELNRLDTYLKAISLIQRLLRGWLARQDFLHKRAAAVLVQSWFRARITRRKYIRQLTLIVRVQRRWRHQLAKKRRMSYEIRRRTQRKQQLLELQAQQANLDHQFRFRWTRAGERSLDIPEDLAELYRVQRNWRPLHHLGQLQELDLGELRLRERRRRRCHQAEPLSVPFLASASGANPEAMASLISQLETDEGHSLRDLLHAYYPKEVPQFGYSRLTITRPFSWPKLEEAKRKRLRRLIKKPRSQNTGGLSGPADIESRFKLIEQQACTVYKLLLRYVDSDFKAEQVGSRMNEAQHDEEISLRLLKFKLLADYLMHLCIKEPLLRNELYLQLLSLSWQNPRPQSLENVWRFMAACLAVFAPTDRQLCSIMLRYAHEYCPNHLRRQALLQIARLILEPRAPTRVYGSSLLEYWAQRKMVTRIALLASCYMDDNSLNGPMECPEMNPYEASTTNYSSRTLVLVGSRTTAQQLATATLKARQLPSHNLNGWSVEIQHDGAQSELSCRLRGDQVVFDHIAKAETMPEFLKMIQATVGESKGRITSWHQQQITTTTDQENRYSASSSNRKSAGSKRLSYRQSSDGLNYPPRGSIYYADPRMQARGPPPTSNNAMMLNKRRSMSMQELQLMQSPRYSNHYYGDSETYYQHSAAGSRYPGSSGVNSRVENHRLLEPRADYATTQQQQPYYRVVPRVADNQRRRSQTPTGSMSHYSARQHRMSIGNESRRSSNSHMNYATDAYAYTKNREPITTGGPQFVNYSERNMRHRRSSTSSSRPLMLRERPIVSVGNHGAYATPSSLVYSQPLVGSKQKSIDNSAHYVASSVISDTSEAPSMASHVRGVKVPQHNDDLDQYLDDLFNPMLNEVDLDEFSDSKSIANSVRVERQNGLMGLCNDTKRLASALRGTESPIEIETKTTRDSEGPPEPSALSPTFESLLESLHQQTNDQETELKEAPVDNLAEHSTPPPDKQIPLPPPPPPPPSFSSNPTSNNTDKKIAVEQSDTSSKQPVNVSQTNPTGSVGKLKISSELKAKLEQLNTVSTSSTTQASSSQDSAVASVSGGIVQQATKSLMEVKRLSEQRRNLLESQLSAAGSDNPDSARSSTSEFSTGKVLAAKQQLAAAAGLALTQLMPASSPSSRLSIASGDNVNPAKQLPDEVSSSKPEEASETSERRCRQFKDEELGPQSRAAINQRQAFYRLSMSSDQLDKQLRDVNHHCKEIADSDTGVEEPRLDNRSNSRQVSAVKMSNSDGVAALTRSPQIGSNLNEAGQNTAIGAMCEQLYSSTRQQQQQQQQQPMTLLQRQQESLKRGRKLAGEQHQQWVSSSPDLTIERVRSRRRELTAAPAEQSDAMVAARRDAMVGRNQVAEELYMSYSNVDWQIKIRKEFFMPSETYEAPLVVQLIFTQLVADVFNPRHWTRLNNKERAAIKSLMKDNAIGYAPSLPAIGQMLEVKLELIRMARSFGLYFTRAYPASNFALGQCKGRASWSLSSSSMSDSTTSDDEDEEEEESTETDAVVYNSRSRLEEATRQVHRLRKANNLGENPFDFVAIHHSGLRLVVVEGCPDESAADNCGYKVLETLKYRDMVEVVLLGGGSLMVSMRNEKKSWIISSEQAGPLATLLTCFLADYNSHILNNNNSNPAANNQSHTGRLQAAAKQENHAKRGSSPRRQPRRSTKNALLASHDDHHGDHFKQRQAPDSVGKLHPAAHSDYDLAYAKPALPEPVASPTRPAKQSAHNWRLGGPTRAPHGAQPGAGAAAGLQLATHKPLPDTPDNRLNQAASRPLQLQPPASGSHKQRGANPAAKQQPLREQSLLLEDDDQLERLARQPATGDSSCQLKPASNTTTSSQSHSHQQLPQANNNNNNNHRQQVVDKQKHHSLWQSSLSRMSNKFALLAGSPRAQPPDGQQMDHQQPQKHQKNHASPPLHLCQPPASSSLYAAPSEQQQHTTSIQQQVAMDAWIETKVLPQEETRSNGCANGVTKPTPLQPLDNNYETDLADNQIEASIHEFDAEIHSPAGSQPAEPLGSSTNCNSSVGSRRGETFGPTSDQAAGASQEADGRYSMLQFALYNFWEAIDKYSLESRVNEAQAGPGDTSTLRGSLKLIESLRGRSNNTTNGYETVGRQGTRSVLAASSQNSQVGTTDWTWRELAEMVKFTKGPLKHSLLKLNSDNLEKRALECFDAMRQYMGDAEAKQNEVECVYLLLMTCHNYPSLRDEIYCQLMKQTTNNRSEKADSCLRGWRLFSIMTAYFDCSPNLKPYLFKFLESNAFDKRRAYCSVSALCLENLRKTFKYGGRKNVPSVEEIAATSAGRNSKRQIYRLPGGTERVINTKSTTVVEDIIQEICTNMLMVTDPLEMLEFSLYCIADGDLHTMPLNRDEYILDVTTELIKSHQHYFLIFCRSIWYHPLRLDSRLYIEVIFNQIAPDYLEGLLLVLPALSSSHRHQHSASSQQQEVGLRLRCKLVKEVARIGALLHRASGTDNMPHKDEMKYLIPKPIVTAMKHIQRAQQRTQHSSTSNNGPSSFGGASGSGSLSRRQTMGTSPLDTLPRHQQEESRSSGGDMVLATPQMWTELVQANWREMSAFDTLDAKAQFLDIVRHWPLFGSSFFAIKFIQKDLIQSVDFILALNRQGVHMVDVRSHETVHRYPFNEVISTRKVRSEDGALYLDLKCGNLMKRTIIRIRTDQAHEISRLIRQYINIELLRQKQQHHPNTSAGEEATLLPSMGPLE